MYPKKNLFDSISKSYLKKLNFSSYDKIEAEIIDLPFEKKSSDLLIEIINDTESIFWKNHEEIKNRESEPYKAHRFNVECREKIQSSARIKLRLINDFFNKKRFNAPEYREEKAINELRLQKLFEQLKMDNYFSGTVTTLLRFLNGEARNIEKKMKWNESAWKLSIVFEEIRRIGLLEKCQAFHENYQINAAKVAVECFLVPQIYSQNPKKLLDSVNRKINNNDGLKEKNRSNVEMFQVKIRKLLQK